MGFIDEMKAIDSELQENHKNYDIEEKNILDNGVNNNLNKVSDSNEINYEEYDHALLYYPFLYLLISHLLLFHLHFYAHEL